MFDPEQKRQRRETVFPQERKKPLRWERHLQKVKEG